jgi:hypothetical protein
MRLVRPRELSAVQDDNADAGGMNHTRLTAFSPNVAACIGPICMRLVVASQAQSLTPASRTVFKCEVAAKVVYSDSRCLAMGQPGLGDQLAAYVQGSMSADEVHAASALELPRHWHDLPVLV